MLHIYTLTIDRHMCVSSLLLLGPVNNNVFALLMRE